MYVQLYKHLQVNMLALDDFLRDMILPVTCELNGFLGNVVIQ